MFCEYGPVFDLYNFKIMYSSHDPLEALKIQL